MPRIRLFYLAKATGYKQEEAKAAPSASDSLATRASFQAVIRT